MLLAVISRSSLIKFQIGGLAERNNRLSRNPPSTAQNARLARFSNYTLDGQVRLNQQSWQFEDFTPFKAEKRYVQVAKALRYPESCSHIAKRRLRKRRARLAGQSR